MAMNTLAAVESSVKCFGENFSLKSKQHEAIVNIVNGKDTLAILPTGYGKTLIYQLLPSICRLLEQHPSFPIVIVISPLTALIESQMQSAISKSEILGLKPSTLSSSPFEEISSGKYNILIDSPENWLETQWKNLLTSNFFRRNVVAIVVDEVHLVSWGLPDEKTGEAFRIAFNKIGELRSFCSEHVPVLALSATVDFDFTSLISAACNLSKFLKIIHCCSDRKNLRLSVIDIKDKSVDCFHWLFAQVREKGNLCPKVLIYCRTQSLVFWLYEQFLIELGKFSFKDGNKSSENRIIGMYHSDTLPVNKQLVMNSLLHNKGNVRVVIATSALGCGVDCQQLSYVFHFGPSHSIVDYSQQIGRAGRSGEDLCHAVLYFYPQSKANVAPSMKNYISSRNIGCLRTKLFSPFNENNDDIPPLQPSHLCCSFCSKSCNCSSLHCKLIYPFEIKLDPVCPTSDSDRVKVRNICSTDEIDIKSLLVSHHEDCATSSHHLVPVDFISGLTESLIEEIIRHLPFIDSPEYLIENLTFHIEKDLAVKLVHLIKNHFKESCIPMVTHKTVDEDKQYVFSDSAYSEDDVELDFF